MDFPHPGRSHHRYELASGDIEIQAAQRADGCGLGVKGAQHAAHSYRPMTHELSEGTDEGIQAAAWLRANHPLVGVVVLSWCGRHCR